MRTVIWSVVAALTLCIVVVDHYSINMALTEFESARDYNTAEMTQAFQMQDSVRFAAVSQEVVRMQAQRIIKLENALEEAGKIVQATIAEKKRVEQVLEETAKTVAELNKENAELQAEVDTLAPVFEEKVQEAKELQKQLATIQKTLDKLTSRVIEKLENTD